MNIILIFISCLISFTQALYCGALAATKRAECNQYFAYVKAYYCSRFPIPGDGYGNCVTRAASEFDACIAAADAQNGYCWQYGMVQPYWPYRRF